MDHAADVTNTYGLYGNVVAQATCTTSGTVTLKGTVGARPAFYPANPVLSNGATGTFDAQRASAPSVLCDGTT